jgi:5-formyltetrahydrofolate cyclo-ligase
MSLAALKKQARSDASDIRKTIHENSGSESGIALAARGLPIQKSPQQQIISAFHSFGTEISTFELFERLVRDGWTTALPIVLAKNTPLMFRTWVPGEPLVSGLWGIQIPPDTAPEVQPDVLLVPLLAFDRKGYRLGYGGGFYDRTLEKLRAIKKVTAIGIAYAGQEVGAVLRDEHDQHLDWIMTDREVIACGRD